MVAALVGVSISGTVAGKREIGQAKVVMVNLKTDSGQIAVMLAPKNLLDPGLTEMKGSDSVEVTGSKVKHNERDVILAKTVKVGDKEYTLRKDEGQVLGKDGNPIGAKKK
ncbi:MAG: hypothetical protein HY727_04690 [Candidatus Rokubacteria bacterium]|nr:hypothetical protein [Candidatus Rokubacteria bacterium]